MTWKEAIKRSKENTAVLTRGDYAYLKYPNGSVFHAKSGSYTIKKKCHGSEARVDGTWEPLGGNIGNIDDFK
jgi:hypothetical protein